MDAAPELVRRGLLALVTALVVARPLVLGEDPGLLVNRISDASGLLLGLLWLLAATGTAAWRAWRRESIGRPDGVEIALAATAAAAFASARWAAAYRHPAWLVSWEWVVCLAAYAVVRRLMPRPEDAHNLLAAFLAAAVSVSAYGIYQSAVEIPQLRRQFEADPDRVRQELAKQGISVEAGDPQMANWARRIRMDHVYATFAHPNSLAGYLALALPACLAWAGCAWRARGSSALSLSAWGCALAVSAALLLTHSRGAIAGVAVAGAVVAVRAAWLRFGPKGLVAVAAVVALALATAGAAWRGWTNSGVEKARQSLGLRGEYWAATWRMIRDPHNVRQFWLGVGPGNFGRYYPRYVDATASEKVSDPHNLALEVWSTSGVVALAALTAAFVLFFRGTAPDWSTAGSQDVSPASERPRQLADWEFYLGGMAGLVLGFALWAAGRSSDQLLIGGLLAVGRSLVWFAAFALLKGIPVRGQTRRIAAAAGIVALLVNLTVSGGITFPSVSQSFWVMAALALPASTVRAPAPGQRPGVAAIAIGVVAVVYALWIFLPVSRAGAILKQVQQNAYAWQTAVGPEFRKARERGGPGGRGARAADEYLRTRLIAPLLQATEIDPGDASPWLQLAHWYGQDWRLVPRPETRTLAIRAADAAIALDPEGKEGYLTKYRLNSMFAQGTPDEAPALYGFAAANLAQAVQRDPTEARLRYWLAETLRRAGKTADAKAQAQKAVELDHLSSDPVRKLTVAERENAEQWASGQPQ